MAILKVAHLGHPCLREVAEPVAPRRIGSRAVQRLIDDMIETMREHDGIGLAAPQVHASLRVVVYEVDTPDPRRRAMRLPLTVLVNPVIRPRGDEMEEDWEGCLSLPDLRGKVPRYTALEVEAYDRDGARRTLPAKGFHARVVQHECDHLDGKVFIDRMRDFSTLAFLPEFLRYGGVEGDVE